jgi:hypothetical protein
MNNIGMKKMLAAVLAIAAGILFAGWLVDSISFTAFVGTGAVLALWVLMAMDYRVSRRDLLGK